MPTTRTPAPPRRQVYRRKQRRHRPWLWLLPAAALLALAAAVLLYDAAPAPQDAPAAKPGDAPSEPQDDRIVVAVDPGHGGVNPNIGSEDYGAEGCGLRECDITLQTARLLCAKLEADGRFRPLLTADGSAYLKPSQRAELAIENARAAAGELGHGYVGSGLRYVGLASDGSAGLDPGLRLRPDLDRYRPGAGYRG